MNRSIVVIGVLLAIALMVLRVVEYNYLNRNINTQLYIGIISLVALFIGVWFGREFLRKKQIIQKVTEELNHDGLKEMGLSDREIEILEMIEKGNTNQEIADKLFISLNTIKTHTTNIYQKLDVRNRVQAIAKAKSV